MKNVILRGPVFDILPYFQACDIHILTSEREGMPNTVIEGMSCAVPTVATAISGINEIIEENKDGVLVPVGNPEAVSFAISKLAGDANLRRRLGLAARQKITGRYDIGLVAAATVEMYRSICTHFSL
jgi:glycosyltransferase involved in cell wall biosynthesis